MRTPIHHTAKQYAHTTTPNPKTNPHPAQRAPANARAGKHKPTNKHDRDEHHNSDSSARHQVGGFCLAEILGFGTRIGNPFFTCNWDFSLEWRGFVVFGCAFWVYGCFGGWFWVGGGLLCVCFWVCVYYFVRGGCLGGYVFREVCRYVVGV